jgi:TPR repeat protein
MNSLAVRRDDPPGEGPVGRIAMGGLEARKGSRGADDADRFVQLGMMHMTGRAGPVDLVAAHKWFNLAAMYGDKTAVRLRREIAAEMSQEEIAAAQRAARDWRAAR